MNGTQDSAMMVEEEDGEERGWVWRRFPPPMMFSATRNYEAEWRQPAVEWRHPLFTTTPRWPNMRRLLGLDDTP